MNKSIPAENLERAAREFALRQIQIVEPRLALCLGKAAFNAVRVAAGLSRTHSLADAIEIASPFTIGKTLVWCQAHTSQQGINTRHRNGTGQVDKDWARMALAYAGR